MAGNTVVVGVGQKDEARIDALAETVRKLVRTDEDRLVLVHVYAEEDAERLESMLDIDADRLDDLAVAVSHNTAVRDVREALDDLGIEPEFRGRLGDPGEEIVEIAEADGADFVVVGGRRRSPVGKALFGSTAQAVLLSAPCPVVFFRGAAGS